MAFRFSLAALLRLRATLEQVEERKLMSLRHEAQRFELAIEQNIASRRDQRLQQGWLLAGRDPIGAGQAGDRHAGDRHATTGLTGADLQFSHSCLARLELSAQQLQQQLVSKQEDIRLQLGRFTAARRQREAIESLRERQLELYRTEERRREQRSLDDLFLVQLLLARQGRPRG
jgi:flagellar biosynthesis chaperone FliJ